MSPEEAAAKGLISGDEYLDLYGEPRRPWPAVEERDSGYCAICQHFFARRENYNRHMRRFHVSGRDID